MPRENFADVHYDRPLTNISCAYFQDPSVFVSGRFFPIMNVMKASDRFDTYPQGYWNRIYDSRRAEESVANSITYKVKADSYSVGDDALRHFISDKKRANVDTQRKLDMEATTLVTQAIALAKEHQFAETYMQSTSAWTHKKAVPDSPVTNPSDPRWNNKWNSSASDPVKDVKAICKDIYLSSAGRKPNKAIITYDVWIELTEHEDIVDRVKYMGTNTNPGKVTMQAVASLFELDEILVMTSIGNEALAKVEDSNGNPPVDNQFLVTKTMLIGHVPQSVGLMTPCAGITFAWNSYIAHSAMAGPSIRRYRPTDGRKGEYIEAELSIDQKLVSGDMGAIITNLV